MSLNGVEEFFIADVGTRRELCAEVGDGMKG
jgi:hypothetical protein